MEPNNNDNYVLVLEDRTEVKNEQEAGKISVVSGIDDKGNLKTTEAAAANQAAFLKFNNKDGLLKNFMSNFLKQFNNPTRFGLYKVLANNVEQGVDNLRTMLQSREKPESKQQLTEIGVSFDDYLPKKKNATAIDESKIDWKQLGDLGLTRERLEQSGELEKMLLGRRVTLLLLPYLLVTRPSTPKHVLHSARMIMAMSAWLSTRYARSHSSTSPIWVTSSLPKKRSNSLLRATLARQSK